MNKGFVKYVAIALLILALVWKIGYKADHPGPKKEIPASGVQWKDKIRSLAAEISYSRHARCRMDCRHIDESEVRDILLTGEVNTSRIEESEKGISVPLEGITKDQQHVRIVVAPKEKKLVLVTVIDLDKDWTCDCP